jgi:hypothetical protein
MIKSPRNVPRNSVIFSSPRVMLAPSAVVRVFMPLLLLESVVGLFELSNRSRHCEERSDQAAPRDDDKLRGEFCAENI